MKSCIQRLVSAERREPPDIDFESERREEVIPWVCDRYGRDRAAQCCIAMRFRARGAIRDVGRVMSPLQDLTGMLAQQVRVWSDDGVLPEHAEALNLKLDDRRLLLASQLARELIVFPCAGPHRRDFCFSGQSRSITRYRWFRRTRTFRSVSSTCQHGRIHGACGSGACRLRRP